MSSTLRSALLVRAANALLKIGELRYPAGEPRIVQCRIEGFSLLVLANEDVGRQIAVLGRYERADSRALVSLLRPTDDCADVGANVGYFTMLMASHVPRGSVVAFEPGPLNFALLRAGVALNGFANVETVYSAVGAEVGTASFVDATDGAYSSLQSTGRSGVASRRQVPMTTLDAYSGGTGRTLDVVKIDVEGAERLVVDGAAGLLGSPRRPRVMMIELCEQNLSPFGTSIDSIVDALRAREYTPWVAIGSRLVPFRAEHRDRYFNVFFLQPGVSPARADG
jgi:FkbM family methyltransferase